jgi:glycosyltransferase involved in cell wall biosynthesis
MGMMPGSFCLVAIELDPIVKNGGIGTTNWLLVHLLARHGWKVHILYCTPVADRGVLAAVRKRLAKAGIAFTHIDELKLPKPAAAPDALGGVYLPISERVRWALEELHRRHRFDLIEFAEVIGAGFRALQAKRAGLAFADAGTIVKLHSMSQWLREGNCWWMNSGQDLLIDYIERRAFEQADFQLSPSRYLLDYARQIGWQVRPDAQVVRYPFPAAQCLGSHHDDTAATELVFFGRLEARKGLEVFLSALDEIDPQRPVTFLGKDTILEDGSLASERIAQRLAGRPYQLLTDFDRDRALAYLAGRNCVAILPSLVENYANALIECLVNGIPFLASRAGGMPEIVPQALHSHLLFEPNVPDLVRCLTAYLDTSGAERRAWREQALAAAEVQKHNQHVLDAYSELLEAVRRGRATPPLRSEVRSLVTVAVHGSDDSAALAATLRSLTEQSYPRLDVRVADGSAEARNQLLADARGNLFLTVAAGQVLHPTMLDRLVNGLGHNPECSAMTCYVLEVDKPADRKRGQYAAACRPTGGPFLMGSLLNVYGEDVALYRTSALRAAGGFEAPYPDSAASDWPTYVKLARLGHALGVVPDYLVWRLRSNVSTRSPAWFRTHRQVLDQYVQAENLPEAERVQLWTALVSFYQQHTEQLERLHKLHEPLRYRLVDQANALAKKLPLLHPAGRSAAAFAMALWKRLTRSGRRLNREVVR